MAVHLNTNLVAMNTQRNLSTSQSALAISLSRISSGLRINRAQDDAAGLAISSRMTSQINGSSQAIRNANDGISMVQTAEGAMGGISDSLQRMRELSVQAANGPISSSDRKLINDEVQQLSAEIQRIASATDFNGIKLLDGSFNARTFNIGANQGDTISISAISNMQTSHLGSTGSSFKATVTGGVVTASLNAGDLKLNNFAIDASTAGAAVGQAADSAFALAAAINASTATSGVSASANANKLISAAPSSFTAIAGFNINGVDIGGVSAGTDASSQGANFAAAIQGAAAQTGVSATANAGIVTLSAADGRNINIGLSGTAANAAATAANKATFLSQSGLSAGMVGTQGTAAVAAQNTFNIANNVGAGAQFAVNGISFTVRNSGLASAVVDANHVDLNIAGASNNAATVSSALSGAISMAQSNPLTAAALSAFSVADGGGTVVLNDNAAGSSSTSISSNAGSVTRNIAGAASSSGSAAANRGTISVSSLSTEGLTIAGAAPESAGMTAGNTAAIAIASIVGITSLNTLTASSAQNAIASLDSALDIVNIARGALGAYQNRFVAAASNLQNTLENLSASRSRIQDADFAAETGSITRANILQQAGTAMLAQANTTPYMVMALLKGAL
ncbi:flagellin [Iodobacter sp. CM08]|uniref:flagellin N-terminal helical domain-containing protein n=1 Tax=Iodobacter sp. CM08 TaxID=3085902 RepID=UPI002980D5B5|nr:flagellin [Iodobacter sp. CM08]MDW5418319.1 flagellin [Iodobacter sp. CM08]